MVVCLYISPWDGLVNCQGCSPHLADGYCQSWTNWPRKATRSLFVTHKQTQPSLMIFLYCKCRRSFTGTPSIYRANLCPLTGTMKFYITPFCGFITPYTRVWLIPSRWCLNQEGTRIKIMPLKPRLPKQHDQRWLFFSSTLLTVADLSA